MVTSVIDSPTAGTLISLLMCFSVDFYQKMAKEVKGIFWICG